MSVIKFILKLIPSYKKYLSGIAFAIFIVSICANLKPYLTKLLIDTALNSTSDNFINLILFYGFIHILIPGAWTLSDWFNIKYSPSFRCHIVHFLMQHLSCYQYSFFQNNLSGAISAKVNDVFNLVPSIIDTFLYKFFHFILITIIALILLSEVHFSFIFVTFLWMTFFLIITFFGMKTVKSLTTDMAESKTTLCGHIVDYLNNMISVRYFNAQKYEMHRMQNYGQDYIQKTQKQGTFLMKFYIIQGLGSAIYFIICFIALVYFHKNGLVTAGDFALVLGLNASLVDQLFSLSHNIRDFVNNWATVEQALKTLNSPLENQDKLDAFTLKIKKGEIIFDQVKFHYKDTKPLFEDISIKIEAGKKVGLVGYSGSGKTTFVNLITRLFDINSGQVLIDGQKIQNVTQESLHFAVGTIPQDPILFHRSLMENIRYGKLEVTDAEVIEASQKACAHEFIINLPQGYESLVGERGIKLSGGQRQRIAIARAFLKNAPILILDEATSQLDSITEQYIQETLWELMKGKTTLVIAHRLSTLLNMDRILVFNKGKIVEDGLHNELIAKNSYYKQLWDAQMGGFLPETEKVNLPK